MILYFSGTGNSKYVAQRMAEALNQSLLSMNDRIRSHDTSPVETDERLVIVTPTYAWRIPRLVRDWLLETEFPGAAQAWFIMTCGSEIGHASRYNRSLCQTKGLTDMGTAQIIMPENYIAMFDAPQAEEARRIVAKAQPDIDRSIAAVREGRPFPPPYLVLRFGLSQTSSRTSAPGSSNSLQRPVFFTWTVCIAPSTCTCAMKRLGLLTN